MTNKPRKKKRKKYKRTGELKIDQILLHNRLLFLFSEITEETAYHVVRRLIALDLINNKPIALYINSPGGSVEYGFSIIDAIKGIKSPVYTIISGEACSMAGIISVAGDKRLMTRNSVFMSHDMSGGITGDYTTKVLDRADFLKKEQKRITEFLRKHTKLSNVELKLNMENYGSMLMNVRKKVLLMRL